MNIVITGGLGHIGSYLFKFLIKQKFVNKILIVDNLYSSRFCSLFNTNSKGKLKFIESNLKYLDLNLLNDFDYFIHLAALTDASNSLKFKKEYLENNLSNTKRIVNFCQKNNKRFIFPSSTSVYGKSKDIVDESLDNDFLKPQSPYAEIKLLEEDFITQKKKLNFVILRLGTIFGVSSGMRFHTAINKFCWQASFDQEITVWETAYDQVRPYLGINDATRAISFILRYNHFNSQTYNIVSENSTVRNIIEYIKLKKDVRIKFVKNKIMNQLSYGVSSKKFVDLGFNFKDRIEDGVTDTMDLLDTKK